MTRKNVRHPAPDDIENAQRLFEKTKDPRFIVLAIGASPVAPPIWALDAAVELARRTAKATRSGNDRLRSGTLLNDMIREFFRLHDPEISRADYIPPSVLSVIKTVLAQHGTPQDSTRFETERKKLDNAWRVEARGCEDWDPSGVPQNARYKRLVREWGDEELGLPYNDIAKNAWKLRQLGII